ncbi:hypothetical protein SDC9_51958 [bioreactor metagenome]|uniref:Uncharacterized protein n=1 Tax=bioreactor metagenome TaxID=1076179 RepID=A0A644WPT8_9ZZZZ
MVESHINVRAIETSSIEPVEGNLKGASLVWIQGLGIARDNQT